MAPDASFNDVVLCEKRGPVALLTLNRPERSNGWTPRVSARYFQLLRECTADDEVRAIVLTGAGRAFCAGADVEVLDGLVTKKDPRANAETRRPGRTPSGRRETPMEFPLSIPKPIVAAVNGACAGLGLAHALMCDVRFAADGAKFTTAFARRGLIAEQGLSWLLPHMIGRSKAADLLLSARVFYADEALRLGIVDHVVPRDEVLDAALAYAHDLAANCSPTSMAVIKSELLTHPLMAYEDAMQRERELVWESWERVDFKEGVNSFRERRPPQFPPLDRRFVEPVVTRPADPHGEG